MPWLWACLFWFLGCLCPGCGRVYGLSLLCPGCGLVLFGWFAIRLMLVLFRADAPFPIFIGEVLSVFLFLCGPWFLVFFLIVCVALPFW